MPPDLCPVADGGEGTIDALLPASAARRSPPPRTTRSAARCRPASPCVEDGGTALVETAAASGLGLVAEAERDAWAASTYGTGELICAAVDAGAPVILVAVGGSATTDGGAGALEAIEAAGGLRRREDRGALRRHRPVGARAAVFGPRRAPTRRWSSGCRAPRRTRRPLPRDPRGVPMTGAAGGLSGGLWAAHGATLEPGAPWILDALDFDARMRAARAVVTGEGKLDEQTLQGKLVGEIGTRTRQAGVPLHAIVGTDALDAFGKRMIDLQVVIEATTLAELEAAGEDLGRRLATGEA